MELLCAEQPFLNYLIVTSGRPYSSLFALNFVSGLGLPEGRWAGGEIGEVVDGSVRTPDGRPLLLVHWAGMSRQMNANELPHANLWSYYRNLELGSTAAAPNSDV